MRDGNRKGVNVMLHNKAKALNLVKAAMIALLIILFNAAILFFEYGKTDDVDMLIQKLKDEDCFVRDKATEALVIIGTPAVEPLLAARMKTIMSGRGQQRRWGG